LGGASTDLLAQQERTLQAATRTIKNEQNNFIKKVTEEGLKKTSEPARQCKAKNITQAENGKKEW
jgi:hypothetical protein